MTSQHLSTSTEVIGENLKHSNTEVFISTAPSVEDNNNNRDEN
jgi:hypothetical protein